MKHIIPKILFWSGICLIIYGLREHLVWIGLLIILLALIKSWAEMERKKVGDNKINNK